MIPSDHFVRFYNEVFKFLDSQGDGELEKYYRLISEQQEMHCLELFLQPGADRNESLLGSHSLRRKLRHDQYGLS